MSFLAQSLAIAALFATVEAVEAGLRWIRPGWPDIVYWSVKLLVGLPIVLAVLWAAKMRGIVPEAAPVTVGICLAAAAALWLYGDGPEQDEAEKGEK